MVVLNVQLFFLFRNVVSTVRPATVVNRLHNYTITCVLVACL
jgi:hypothetical protein